MTELILRAAAIDALGECPENWTDSPEEIAAENAWYRYKDAIEHISTVDAVPVIRCANCKYWNTDWEPTGFDPNNPYHFCDINDIFPTGDWFCADGKRKDDEND